MDHQIWQWTLTKEAIAPCFVRDVLAMRQSNRNTDFFWLGHTPCRTVILVGMVVGIQVYDKRAIYTIDDGTAVIDCVLRYPHPTPPAPAQRPPPRSMGDTSVKPVPKSPSPKKPRLDKAKLESTEPPPPITEPGYPVRVVGRVVRHWESKQIHADTIDPCPSSLDEIAHLERVITLHKTKYSLAVPFVLPPKPTSHTPLLDSSTNADVFSNIPKPSRPSTALYSLPPPPPPPPILMPLQARNQPPFAPTHLHSTYHSHTRVPSSPTTSSIASSTPSSPCKPSSPVKAPELSCHTDSFKASCKPKLRHPSRLHTRDLTGNVFRIYVKHYMDNALPPFAISLSSPSRGACGGAGTPTKRARDEGEDDEPTPRLRTNTINGAWGDEGSDDGPILGFTLSHLRRVPELALLAARIVRAEARRRYKANREKEQGSSGIPSSTSASAKANGSKNRNPSTPTPQTTTMTGAPVEPPRKKMKRLFLWAVVKLYEEGSIVLWDGDARPLPVPPPPVFEGGQGGSGVWKGDETLSILQDSVSWSRSYAPSAPVLYTSSASASLYSHYHSPRRPHRGSEHDADEDADPGHVSEPGVDEEAYVPLTPRLLAEHIEEALGALRRGRSDGVRASADERGGGTGSEPTPEDILAYLQRADGRWARVGVWAVEEALALCKVR